MTATTTPREAALTAYQAAARAAFDDHFEHPNVTQTTLAIFNSPAVQTMLAAHEAAVLAAAAERLRARANEVPDTAPQGARQWARAMSAAARMTDPRHPGEQHRTNTAVLLAGRGRRATGQAAS